MAGKIREKIGNFFQTANPWSKKWKGRRQAVKDQKRVSIEITEAMNRHGFMPKWGIQLKPVAKTKISNAGLFEFVNKDIFGDLNQNNRAFREMHIANAEKAEALLKGFKEIFSKLNGEYAHQGDIELKFLEELKSGREKLLNGEINSLDTLKTKYYNYSTLISLYTELLSKKKS
ncbi:MAG: hypothetical protein JW703_01360 [Candidatus Diapherotrites archaeon]|nr:hypothetical protein [Candidatus Diapherotrites archaeon]